tara:strand:+ start:8072 stop:8917 length:846 start_codon:yes stop_codon:yes gene_type:complete
MKVINFEDKDFSYEFYKSFKEHGIAIIDNHGIDLMLYKKVQHEWSQFFASNDKHKYDFKGLKDEGYIPPCSVEKCLESEQVERDLKELAHFYSERLPAEISCNHNILQQQMMSVALICCQALDEITPQKVFKSDNRSFYDMINQAKKTCLRVNHYLQKNPCVSKFICAAHKDINFITLLLTNNDAMIQSKDRKGKWLNVPCDKPYLIVNSGETLEAITDSHFPSNVHRVLNPHSHQQTSRVSMAFLTHAHCDVQIPGYKNTEDYVKQKLSKIGFNFECLNF